MKWFFMKSFLHFLIPTVYQALHYQNKLKTWYFLFWFYYDLGRLNQNKTIRECPQDFEYRLEEIHDSDLVVSRGEEQAP